MESGAAPVRKTPLHAVHVAAGGRMVPFAGWELPVQYAGTLEEHLAVRTRAGLFDVSHMGEVRVAGPEALAYLQFVTCNDVSKLVPGRIQYSALTTPEGTLVDDLLVYRLGQQEYLLVINAGNTPKDVDWLGYHAKGFQVDVRDESPEWAQIAIQGPRAIDVLRPLVAEPIDPVQYYGFVVADVAGVRAIVSRTGYTGEDGFEVYAPAEAGPALWNAMTERGREHGLVPCGLGARDTLRLEAKMALYGNDVDDTTTVLEADLGWICKLGKGDFLGRDVLVRQKADGVSRKLVGFETEGRGAIARHGYRALRDGVEVGVVTSGTFAPFLKKNIGLAYLPAGMWEPGTRFEVEIRNRRESAVVVPTPFYRRAR